MNSKPFANEDVMEDYMSALLTEETGVEELQRHAIAHLLETAKPVQRTAPFVPQTEPESVQIKVNDFKVDKAATVTKNKSVKKAAVVPEREFQALFFEIAGLTLAVPLTELGGIHKIDTINPLFGKPKWFKGVMLHKEQKFNVVDTAKWIMPEKSAEKVAESTKYQYLIVLGDSGWGLGCEVAKC